MEERRRVPRINEENEVTLVIFSEEDKLPKERLIDNYTKDISKLGAKIHTNILLPIDSLIELEFTSRGLREQINALGIVKWVKVIIEDESYEAGVEFCGAPAEVMERLGEYISRQQEVNDPRLAASWRLDEADGIVAADSVGDKDGTLHGGALWQPEGGKTGGALLLDGVDDYVSTAFVLDPAAGPFSVFAWVKVGPGQVILSQAGGSATG